MPATKPARTARDFENAARSAGYLAAMHGKSKDENPFGSEAMQKAWLSGFAEYLKRMRSVKK